MGTPFVATTLFVLTTLDGAGQLAPIDRSEWPPNSRQVDSHAGQCVRL